jgi:arylsulfatase A-like enzyme
MTEDVWRRGWEGFGPHSPQEPHGYGGEAYFLGFPRFPETIDSMDAVKAWFDGYDVGIRYMDDYVGRLMDALDDAGVLDDTAVVVSADHGENMGELNVWGDHQTADHATCRVPLVVRWPPTTASRVDRSLHYQFDWGATLIELAGGSVPANWDGTSFAAAFRDDREAGRDHLVLSQCAHAAQRSVRFHVEGEAYLYLRSYHDGYKMVEPVMLFNLTRDPHERKDLTEERPDVVGRAAELLDGWHAASMRAGSTNVDPLMTVLREGPLHVRGSLPRYLRCLRATGRAHHANRLAERHAGELQ